MSLSFQSHNHFIGDRSPRSSGRALALSTERLLRRRATLEKMDHTIVCIKNSRYSQLEGREELFERL